MRQRVRRPVAAVLPSLLLGVWAVFLVLAGAGPAPAAGQIVTAASVAPAVPARTDSPTRGSCQRGEIRRVPVAVAPEARVTAGAPVEMPPAPALPSVSFLSAPPAPGPCAGPRQERAPPGPVHGPRQSRAPPVSTSS
ncbi:hypothetical protein [Streptomyces sp. NPDC001985]|uniref:hypothetical protein n=1 Tax=Streptomyces sp. NPDC001985 TaxID=3154406 RepID=UPI003328A23D